MARLIMFCDYIKGKEKKHVLENLDYIATREGVEINSCPIEKFNKPLSKAVADHPVTATQQKLIQKIIKENPDIVELFTNLEFVKKPNMYTASVFICDAMNHLYERDLDNFRYTKYISERPGVVQNRNENHGLWDRYGSADLLSYENELSEKEGNVWRSIISIRREDAVELGFDKADWQALITNKIDKIAEGMGISAENFRWCAAYHDESYHPHIHIMMWSINDKEGFLDVRTIESFKSLLVNDIYQNELWLRKEYKNELRYGMESEFTAALDHTIMAASKHMNYKDLDLRNDIRNLALDLKGKGSTKYSYQTKDVKDQVDEIAAKILNKKALQTLLIKYVEANIELASYYRSLDSAKMNEYINSFINSLIHPGKNDRKVIHNYILSTAINIKKHWNIQRSVENTNLTKIMHYVEDQKAPNINDQTKLALPLARLLNYTHENPEKIMNIIQPYVKDKDKESAAEIVLKVKDLPDLTGGDIQVLKKAYNCEIQVTPRNDNEYILHQCTSMLHSIVSWLGSETQRTHQELKRVQQLKQEDRMVIKTAQKTTSSSKSSGKHN